MVIVVYPLKISVHGNNKMGNPYTYVQFPKLKKGESFCLFQTYIILHQPISIKTAQNVPFFWLSLLLKNQTSLPASILSEKSFICFKDTPTNNFIDYGGSIVVPALIFYGNYLKGSQLSEQHCENNESKTADTSGMLGATPAYTINVDDTINNKNIAVIIIGNRNIFMSITTLGNGEIAIYDCP